MTDLSTNVTAWRPFRFCLYTLILLLGLPPFCALRQHFRPAELWLCTGGDGDLPALFYRSKSDWGRAQDHVLLPGGYGAVRQLAIELHRHGIYRIETLCLPPGPGQTAGADYLLSNLTASRVLICGQTRQTANQTGLADRAAARGLAVWRRQAPADQPLHWQLDSTSRETGQRTWTFARPPMQIQAELLATGEFFLKWCENGQIIWETTVLPCSRSQTQITACQSD